jgi:imidazolonepropionase-like amidohydrolase
MPRRKSDLDDHAYTLPARLHELGVRFCISSTDRSETWNTRALPQHAGTAIAFGLPGEVALKSVTLYPAQILNLDDRIGSIEVGKDASFIITDGDILDTRTQVEAAYIQGRPVELSSRHTRLYEKYQQKYLQPGHIPPHAENAESKSDD